MPRANHPRPGSRASSAIVWLVSNVLFVARDMALKRPRADKVKDVSMLILTCGLIVYLFFKLGVAVYACSCIIGITASN